MRLAKKGEAPKPDDHKALADVPSYPWDHAMKMLGTGDYDVVGDPRVGAERGPDQPAAQMPAPGVDPTDGKEQAAPGQVLTNMAIAGKVADTTGDVPKSPPPAKNLAPPALAPQPAAAPAPAPALAPAAKPAA